MCSGLYFVCVFSVGFPLISCICSYKLHIFYSTSHGGGDDRNHGLPKTETISTTTSLIYTSSSEGALGSCEYKSSPTDVVKVRHVLKESTSDSCTFEVSVKLYSQMYYSKYLAF